MLRIGLVGDGIFDQAAISVFIRRFGRGIKVEGRQCGGGRKPRKALAILKEFDRRSLVDTAIWVTDSETDQPLQVEKQMRDALGKEPGFGFEVKCVVAVQMLEAWLLADEDAVVKVGGSKRIYRTPESLTDPKAQLIRLLNGRLYTPQLAARIAEAANLRKLRTRCESFEKLRQAVIQR